MTWCVNHSVAVLGSSVLLTACSTPFSDKLSNIDWSGPAFAGTIALSQPKMYRRESLINERRLEGLYLDTLMEKSQTIEFKAELVRDVEQITAFAAALGVNFNPANALNYNRAKETADLQQEINVVKLQAELAQLRRDVELVRERFASQTEPVNSGLGTSATNSPAAAASAGTAAADQLTSTISSMNKTLIDLLGAKAREPASASTTSNPSDLFRDRAAYRDLLKAARNATSLDDLHDKNGGALIRLNFQAMVLPSGDRTRVPGVIQMTIKKPRLDDRTRERVYRSWLDHVNRKINRVSNEGFQPDPALVSSEAADSFVLMTYRFRRLPSESMSKSSDQTKPARGEIRRSGPSAKSGNATLPSLSGARTSTANRNNCNGLRLKDEGEHDQCDTLVFALPKFTGYSGQEGGFSALKNYVEFFSDQETDQSDKAQMQKAQAFIVSYAKGLVHECGLPNLSYSRPGQKITDVDELVSSIQQAQIRAALGDEVARIDRTAQQLLRSRKITPPSGSSLSQLITIRSERARFLLSTFEKVAYAGCEPEKRKAFRNMSPTLYVPPDFDDILDRESRIAVYEIGPREQVQQVSSVSQVANNLSLAISLAASAPSTGIGANAAANYSRQAVGRAATIERVPGLIGYATSGETFGWVVTPKAVFDPKGAIRLEQTPRTLDLTVDLSVPSWWPEFNIDATTGWAYDPGTITGGTVTSTTSRSMTVLMDPNYADFDDLTARLKRASATELRESTLDDETFEEQAVSACQPTSLFVRGANIWRATSVIIGGHRVDETGITLAPDMSGILVAVPALDGLVAGVEQAKLPVVIFTRHGQARGKVDFFRKPVPGGCKPNPAAEQDGPVITSISPAEFKSGSELWFTVQGSKLEKIDSVTINYQPGEIVNAPKDGNSLRLKFLPAATDSLAKSRTIPLSFYGNKKLLVEKNVENRD